MKTYAWQVRGVKIYLQYHDSRGTWGLGVTKTPGIFNVTVGRMMIDLYWSMSNT